VRLDDAAPVHFTVELGRDGESSLWVDLPEGSFRRHFHADSCPEAVLSIAVMAAMVLEAPPEERRSMTDFPATDAPADEEQPKPDTAEPDTVPAPAPPAAKLPAVVKGAENVERAQRFSPEGDITTSGVPPAPLHAVLHIDGIGENAVAPTMPLGVRGGFEFWRGDDAWWSPGGRVSLVGTFNETTKSAAGDATFRHLASRLEVSPFHHALTTWLQVIPGLVLEAGSLAAQGGGVAQNPRLVTMLWLAGGLSLHVDVRVSAQWSLEVGADGKLLAKHDQFRFSPSSQIYQVPNRSIGLGVGVVLQL
jgi:hypothetical protein